MNEVTTCPLGSKSNSPAPTTPKIVAIDELLLSGFKVDKRVGFDPLMCVQGMQCKPHMFNHYL